MSKASLYRRMGRQHPFATLRIGTLKANVHRAPRSHNDAELEAEVMKCLREVTHTTLQIPSALFSDSLAGLLSAS